MIFEQFLIKKEVNKKFGNLIPSYAIMYHIAIFMQNFLALPFESCTVKTSQFLYTLGYMQVAIKFYWYRLNFSLILKNYVCCHIHNIQGDSKMSVYLKYQLFQNNADREIKIDTHI